MEAARDGGEQGEARAGRAMRRADDFRVLTTLALEHPFGRRQRPQGMAWGPQHRSRSPRSTSSLAVAAVACGGALLIAVDGSGSAAATPAGGGSATSASQTGASSSVTTALSGDYGLLGESTSVSQTALPTGTNVTNALDGQVQAYGLDLGAARMAAGAGGAEEWLVPGDTGYCYVGFSGGPYSGFIGCADGTPGNGFLGEVAKSPSGYVVMGLVPDGNATVTLTAIDGTEMTARVADNLFVASSSAALSGLQYVGASGATVTDSLALPSALPTGSG